MMQTLNTKKFGSKLLLALLMLAVLGTGASAALAADFASDSKAQLVPCGTSQQPEQCTWADFIALANNIVSFIVFLSSMLVVIAFCYAGFLYLTAAGNSGQVEKAHGVFKTAIMGLVIVLCGWLLIATILKIMVGDSDKTEINKFIEFSSVKTLDNK
jgi:hypothetical protein